MGGGQQKIRERKIEHWILPKNSNNKTHFVYFFKHTTDWTYLHLRHAFN